MRAPSQRGARDTCPIARKDSVGNIPLSLSDCPRAGPSWTFVVPGEQPPDSMSTNSNRPTTARSARQESGANRDRLVDVAEEEIHDAGVELRISPSSINATASLIGMADR